MFPGPVMFFFLMFKGGQDDSFLQFSDDAWNYDRAGSLNGVKTRL